MSEKREKKQKKFKPKARVARGFRDIAGEELALQNAMLETIAKVYAQYGFDNLDTPAFEYAPRFVFPTYSMRPRGAYKPDSEDSKCGIVKPDACATPSATPKFWH